MTSVSNAGAAQAAPPPVPVDPGSPEAALMLPPPGATGFDDPLAEMMAIMQRLSATSLAQTSRRIELTQERLDEALDELLEKLAEAAEEAKKKKDSGGGLFGWVSKVVTAVVDFAVDLGGDVLGSSADFGVDLLTAPFDIIAGLIKGGSLDQLLRAELEQLGEDGTVAEKFDQFVEGVGKFAADVFVFLHAHWGVLEAGLRGENLVDALKLHGGNLYDSFIENCVENEAVWEVTSYALKGLAVASAVASGGALSLVAVGLVLLSEINKRYDLANEIFGPEVGAYVTLGIEVAATVVLACAAGDLEGLGDLQNAGAMIKNVTAVIQGTVGIVKALRDYQEALKLADALDDQADLLEISNRMSMLQRLLETLLDDFEDQTEDQSNNTKRANSIYQTVAATNGATLFPG